MNQNNIVKKINNIKDLLESKYVERKNLLENNKYDNYFEILSQEIDDMELEVKNLEKTLKDETLNKYYKNKNYFKKKDCYNGFKCYKINCLYNHPENWDPEENIPICQYNINCLNDKCAFKHIKKVGNNIREVKVEEIKDEFYINQDIKNNKYDYDYSQNRFIDIKNIIIKDKFIYEFKNMLPKLICYDNLAKNKIKEYNNNIFENKEEVEEINVKKSNVPIIFTINGIDVYTFTDMKQLYERPNRALYNFRYIVNNLILRKRIIKYLKIKDNKKQKLINDIEFMKTSFNLYNKKLKEIIRDNVHDNYLRFVLINNLNEILSKIYLLENNFKDIINIKSN